MTRRHYVMLAEAIRKGRYDGMDPIRTAIHGDYARLVADALAKDNQAFDRARFLAAAGVVS